MSKQSAIKKRQQLMKDLVYQISFQLKVRDDGGLEEDSLLVERGGGGGGRGSDSMAMAAVSAAGFTAQPLPPAPPQNKSAMALYKSLRRAETPA